MNLIENVVSTFLDYYGVFFYQIIIVPLVIYGFLGILALLYKNKKISGLTARTLAHLMIGMAAVLFAEYSYGIIFMIIGLLNGTKHMMTKPSYLYDVDFKRDTWGVWVYSYTFALLSFIALPGLVLQFQIAILVLSISDPSAIIVGRRFPIYRLKLTNKSIGGSIGFFITSVTALLVLFYILDALTLNNFIFILILSLIGAVLEQLSPKGLDNATVPISLFILSYLLF